LLVILALTSCKLILKNKKIGRGVTAEPVLIKIEYRGSCSSFSTVATTVSVNVLNGGCLPINQAVTTLPDTDGLIAHYACTGVGQDRAIIDITEVFVPLDNEYNTPASYVIGIASNAPIRVLGASAIRRPACIVQKQYCNPTATYDVTSCTNNEVTSIKGWILNQDRVYLVPNNVVAPYTCSSPDGTCCAYILSAFETATAFGFCDLTDTSNNALFSVEQFRTQHEEHHEEHNEEQHRPQHHEEHHEEQHRPQHQEEHHEAEHRPNRPAQHNNDYDDEDNNKRTISL